MLSRALRNRLKAWLHSGFRLGQRAGVDVLPRYQPAPTMDGLRMAGADTGHFPSATYLRIEERANFPQQQITEH